ncbi:hypothetical protein BCR44DRAFT_1115906 [Catenaria anguillulae PL171]|uniref:BRCT domain-containing protein n=1 Tax=Catenaria anguillulae PL171 TaxID=765915 RepID=A0A1Y2HM57_9FUNG|nr:hypothetical protein BCR44DRAFT_1115906 [Catenaria anguillulae PL171]
MVSRHWLEACEAEQQLVPTEGYEFCDGGMEERYSFSLKESLDRQWALEEEEEEGWRLFSGLKFFLCSRKQSVLEDLTDIIAAPDGNLISTLPSTLAPSRNAAKQGVVVIASDCPNGVHQVAVFRLDLISHKFAGVKHQN